MDFVLHRGGRFVLAEAKWTGLPGLRVASSLYRVAAQLPKGSVTQMGVICRCANPYPLEGGAQALPLIEVRRLVE